MAQKRSHFDAITFATRGDWYLPRKSPFESAAAANDFALTLPPAYLGRKVSLDRR
jgi:hypothetical protein